MLVNAVQQLSHNSAIRNGKIANFVSKSIPSMSKVQTQAALDTSVFLAGADNIKTDELETFVRELNSIIFRRKSKDTAYRQRELLRLINQTALPKDKRERYLELAEQLDAETIGEPERQEFLRLVAMEEELRNERVRLLLELSQLRQISLPQLMEEMGLTPPGHA